MAKLKVENGLVKILLKTSDGTFVSNYVTPENAEKMAEGAKPTGEVPGYGLKKNNFYFATEEVVCEVSEAMEAKPKGKKK